MLPPRNIFAQTSESRLPGLIAIAGEDQKLMLTRKKVELDRLTRYPGFLLFFLSFSCFIFLGRKICIVAQRVPFIVWLVRWIERAGNRFGIFSSREIEC